jgi:hypothetical protein
MGRAILLTLSAFVALAAGMGDGSKAFAQHPYNYFPSYQLNRYYYYPHNYFPHNYWPLTSPKWPEAPGMPYMKPPAYQAYPPYLAPNWRYEMWQAQKYYRGSHFWLDQF